LQKAAHPLIIPTTANQQQAAWPPKNTGGMAAKQQQQQQQQQQHPNDCKSTTSGMAAEKYRRHGRQAPTSGMAAKQ
jgi:hypothetical protein